MRPTSKSTGVAIDGVLFAALIFPVVMTRTAALAQPSGPTLDAPRSLAVTDVPILKYAYEFWRPITAIHAGERDGNAATSGDCSWEPLCVSPPFPEYNSGHAVSAAAAATVLARELGDQHTFTVASPTLAGVRRTFGSYNDAAREEAMSRIYCGIHFRSAMEAGFAQGEAIADHSSRACSGRVEPERAPRTVRARAALRDAGTVASDAQDSSL